MQTQKYLLLFWSSYICGQANKGNDEHKEAKSEGLKNDETYEPFPLLSFWTSVLDHYCAVNDFSHLAIK